MASDILLARAITRVKPYDAVDGMMMTAFDTVADEYSNLLGKIRTGKYCQDRMRNLLKEYRARKNKELASGSRAPSLAARQETELEGLMEEIALSAMRR